MQSIQRAMTVANVLATGAVENGMSISELSKQCNLPLSTMHRLLQAMIKQGMVEQDHQTKLYRLGMIWLEYGLRVYDTVDYVSKVRPVLENLMREVQESVYLSKPSGTEAIVMERIDCENNPIRIYDQLGIRIPMHIGAANKAMLSAMPPIKVDEILTKLLPAEEIPLFKLELSEIQRKGFAVSHAERTEGTSSFAVAIKDGFGEVIGAISIGVVSFNLTESRTEFLIEHVIKAGRNISEKLAYHGKSVSY
ncbi:IclR family transcriptional regulator [Sporosarcina sp. HYO08]|uniref:IclR family transcriptional regulator n=1 Tax=Sporosarcina sp. HYO08 TaxID=1759557 RepID=UPI0007971FEA|nr:IclR family transcriptional regulator [Sporosarcina sp. HYO08]KXH83819.1 IclR family transcriptional regulator [Sporosarcina sp. HYO08]